MMESVNVLMTVYTFPKWKNAPLKTAIPTVTIVGTNKSLKVTPHYVPPVVMEKTGALTVQLASTSTLIHKHVITTALQATPPTMRLSHVTEMELGIVYFTQFRIRRI